jgi:hypothetical protein
MEKPPTPAPPTMSKKVTPLAIALLNNIQSGEMDPKELSTEKKILCVQFMIQQQSYTVQEMANLLQVDRTTIYNYKKKMYQEDALAQLVIDESVIALEMIETAQHASAKLMSQKKFKDAWTVRRECIDMLQSLGYVKKVKVELNVKGSIDLLGILNLESSMREKESPDDGEENNGPNGNGHSGVDHSSGSRLEEVPE